MNLKQRIIDLSFKHNLAHISSNLTAVDIIDEIYSIKKSNEKFVLSQGHAALALYVVLEKQHPELTAEYFLKACGTHPVGGGLIDCSTGSLGQGLPIAVGMALSNKKKNVYCLVSDGEMAEGSMYEAIKFIERYEVDNIKIYMNYNTYCGYDEISWPVFAPMGLVKLRAAGDLPSFLDGVQGHYHKLTKQEHKKAMEFYEEA